MAGGSLDRPGHGADLPTGVTRASPSAAIGDAHAVPVGVAGKDPDAQRDAHADRAPTGSEVRRADVAAPSGTRARLPAQRWTPATAAGSGATAGSCSGTR